MNTHLSEICILVSLALGPLASQARATDVNYDMSALSTGPGGSPAYLGNASVSWGGYFTNPLEDNWWGKDVAFTPGTATTVWNTNLGIYAGQKVMHGGYNGLNPNPYANGGSTANFNGKNFGVAYNQIGVVSTLQITFNVTNCVVPLGNGGGFSICEDYNGMQYFWADGSAYRGVGISLQVGGDGNSINVRYNGVGGGMVGLGSVIAETGWFNPNNYLWLFGSNAAITDWFTAKMVVDPTMYNGDGGALCYLRDETTGSGWVQVGVPSSPTWTGFFSPTAPLPIGRIANEGAYNGWTVLTGIDLNLSGATEIRRFSITTPNGTPDTSAVSNLRASQRAGTNYVDIYYTLSGGSQPVFVTVVGSSDGGISYNLPMSSVSGDIGSGIAMGNTRHILWNAGSDWPNHVSNSVCFRVASNSNASASSMVAVDTRGTGGLTVTGRVLNSQTNAALSGASVSLAGLNTTSGSNGTFTLAGVNLASGTTLTVSASGFITQTQTVSAAVGANAVSAGDFSLAPNTSNPVVEWVKPDLAGLYLYGLNISTTLRMQVNWNGNTPGQVLVYGDNKLQATLTGSGPGYATTMPVDSWFVGSGLSGTNSVRVVAVGAGTSPLQGAKSINITVLQMPQALIAFNFPGNVTLTDRGDLTLNMQFPSPAINKTVTLPVIGTFGAQIQAGGELDYNIPTGQWGLTLGGSGSSAEVIIGSYTGKAAINGTGGGTASLAKGLTLDSLTLTPSLSLSGEFPLGSIGLPDLLGPGFSTTLSRFPFLSPALDNVEINLKVKPSLTGSATLEFVPTFQFQGFNLNGNAALEAMYNPSIMGASASFYIGGEPSISLQVPGDLFKSVGFRAYAGLTVNAFCWDITFPEYVFVDYTYSSTGTNSLPQGAQDTGSGYMIESVGNANMEPRPMARPWRDAGSEQFVAAQSADALATFNLMGQAPAAAAADVLSSAAIQGPHVMTIPSDPSLPVQAALPLITNVFPGAEPSLAVLDSTLMLLYARDTGATNPLQFTEIAWTHYDGTNWSTPASLAPMANGQLSPKVCFDGNGDAIAVWEQCNDPSYSAGTFEQTASHMEIVWSRWSSATNTWSSPVALTSNSILDHEARLAGPLPNGDLLLTWISNAGNKMAGEGVSGAATNDQVMTARWVAATHSWQTPTTLVANLTGDTCHAFAVGGSKAVFVWGQDMDGNLANSSDTELFYRVMDPGGNWGAATRLTNDNVSDLNARVAIDSNGHVYLVWNHGGDLVMQRDFTGAPTVVRAASTSMGAADFSLALGPGGNLLVIWEDMSDVGADAYYRVYDPASGTWGLDTMLSQDRDLESAFAPVWDASGNLVLAYLDTTIVNQSMTVPVAGGGTITVDGVPQPGQVDLLLARRAIVTDLSIPTNGLTAKGTTFLPGDSVTLTAVVANSGNVAVQNVAVGFYDGDPSAGGTLIQMVTVSGWLKASDQAVVTANWTVPSPALPHTAYVKVDPLNVVTESTKTNNVCSLALNGVNLQVDYASGSVLQDGSVHVVARVSNISAPASPVTTLRLKTGDGTTTLASAPVSQLDPGNSVEIPLDLPAGSQAEGDTSYSLTVDDEALTGDIDTSNNKVLFTLNLFISTMNDGISDAWKRQYGFSVTDPTVANADPDHDGFTNLQEYLAGTNPLDPNSALKISQVTKRSVAQGGGYVVSWASVAGRIYDLERSYDLVNWAVISRNVNAAPPLNTVTDPVTPPFGEVFYRLVALGSADTFDYSPLTRPVAFKFKKQASQGAIFAQLSWSSLAGRTYAVERSTDLVNWQVLSENIAATAPNNSFTDKAPLTQTKAFYRVLEH